MKRRKTFAAVIVAMAVTAYASAQDIGSVADLPREVTQEYRLELGAGSAVDTYLSPIRYSGRAFSISGLWSKSSQWSPENLVMHFAGSFNMRDMRNPSRTASMIGIDGYFGWGLSWRRRLPHNLQVTAGGALDFSGGALYLPRNGNNPVSADAYAGIDVSASVSWRFRIGRVPAILADNVRIPTIGCFFSPQYGETYYEIYLGNHKDLAHCGWWGNRFCIDNLLSLRLDLGRTAMEVGYRYALRSSWVCGLDTKVQSHQFVIGVIPHGLGLKRRRPVNSAIY